MGKKYVRFPHCGTIDKIELKTRLEKLLILELWWKMKISRNFCMIYRKRSFVSKVWKNEKFSPSKLFLQINSLVIYLVKPLLSRNFCQKCVRENSLNFHTVVSVLIANLCSMKIYHFSCHSYFTWNQFLRNQGGKFLKSFLGIEMNLKMIYQM